LGAEVARHVAATGSGRVLYVCYEHSEEFLLQRLLAMESALAGREDPISAAWYVPARDRVRWWWWSTTCRRCPCTPTRWVRRSRSGVASKA
jgi:hypothetical protein